MHLETNHVGEIINWKYFLNDGSVSSLMLHIKRSSLTILLVIASHSCQLNTILSDLQSIQDEVN